MNENLTLNVVVHYIAAPEPFHDHAASRSETVGHLKARVLTAFGLTENGNQTVYTLYHDTQPLNNLNMTLGEVAGDKHSLQLKLDQQVTQG
jgi:hypothetical protein